MQLSNQDEILHWGMYEKMNTDFCALLAYIRTWNYPFIQPNKMQHEWHGFSFKDFGVDAKIATAHIPIISFFVLWLEMWFS